MAPAKGGKDEKGKKGKEEKPKGGAKKGGVVCRLGLPPASFAPIAEGHTQFRPELTGCGQVPWKCGGRVSKAGGMRWRGNGCMRKCMPKEMGIVL